MHQNLKKELNIMINFKWPKKPKIVSNKDLNHKDFEIFDAL